MFSFYISDFRACKIRAKSLSYRSRKRWMPLTENSFNGVMRGEMRMEWCVKRRHA